MKYEVDGQLGPILEIRESLGRNDYISHTTVYCDRRFPALRFCSPLHPVVTSFASSIKGRDGSFLDDGSVEDWKTFNAGFIW